MKCCACGFEHAAVKRAFAACKTAMSQWRSAADCAGWVGGERRRNLAEGRDKAARRALAALAHAEGKGAKK